MYANLDSKRLLKLMKDFYTLTNIKIVIFDADYQEILAYPDNHCSFCTLMHQHNDTRKCCLQSNLHSFENSKKEDALVLYRCHAGLIEATAPLKDKGHIIGYCMFGQITDNPDSEQVSHHLDTICKKYKIFTEHPAVCFSDVCYKQPEQISAAASILEACASYVLMKDLMEIGVPPFVMQLDNYIQEHIQDEIPVQNLCHALDISRSKLYELSAKYLGMGLAQYILLKRIELAKKYLHTTTLSISDVSSRVGFSDYNYFCKVFKRKTGCTAREYRRQNQS